MYVLNIVASLIFAQASNKIDFNTIPIPEPPVFVNQIQDKVMPNLVIFLGALGTIAAIRSLGKF